MNNADNISPEDLEAIERFLQDKMLPEEKQAFLRLLDTNAVLKKNTDELQLLFLGIEEASVKEKLTEFHIGIQEKPAALKKDKVKLLSMKKWMAAASVLLVATLASWWIFFKPGKNERLFTEYFRADPGLVSAMGTSANYSFDRAMVDYKTGNFKAAIKTWDSMQHLQPANDTLNYFLGVAWLANGNPDSAIHFLQKVSAAPGSVFAKDADWYAGLGCLKKGDRQLAILYITRSEHDNKDAVLKRLK